MNRGSLGAQGLASAVRRYWKVRVPGHPGLAALTQGQATGAASLPIVGELLAIALCAVVVASPYLNLDPAVIPNGREYPSHIQPHHLWTRALECGPCAMWNGSLRGGYPAFADPHGSIVHPLVMLTSLGWGVMNGSKLALAGAFVIAGLAQWWLGYVLGLGTVARTWSAMMAVVAGNLAADLQLGSFGLVLSTVSCALALPPLVLVARTGSRRAAVALGVTLALAGLAGQVYMQIGLAFLLPLALLLVPWDREHLRLFASRLGLALGLAVLLGAVLLVPLVHALPQFWKEGDPNFGAAQPFPYIPLNLVINDSKFYSSEALGKLPYPYLYVLFVGWVPVLLALWAVRGGRNASERRVLVFFIACALMAFWLASLVPIAWLARNLPIPALADVFAGLRYGPTMGGLAVPAVLGLAAIGLDQLLATTQSPLRLSLAGSETTRPMLSVDLRWLLVAPLLIAILDARAFSSQWLGTSRLSPDIRGLLEELRTPDLQWVNTPFGEQVWIESAVSMGLKLSLGTPGWNLRDRPAPEPVREANRAGAPAGMVLQATVGGVPVYVAPSGHEYAVLTHADGRETVCLARGTGGDIDVTCEAPEAGLLTVKENNWSGWQAKVDGRAVALQPDRWLVVDLPDGPHTVELRYRPWDVPLGLLLGLTGVLLAVYVWRKPEPPTDADVPHATG